MSSIDTLVAELAPGGVESKSLGEVGVFIRGNGLQKSALTEAGFPAIHYGQIHTHYGTSADTTKSFTDPSLAAKLRRAQPGDLVVVTTSEDDAAVAKATAWMGDGEVAVSGDAYIYRHTLDPLYVAYFFQSRAFRNQKQRYITGTKVRRVSGESLSKIRIPVPPIEVQREIVNVLDRFTELETDLKVELDAELDARCRQFEHYRRQIVVQSQVGPTSTLGELEARGTVRLGRGKVISRIDLAEVPGDYPVYSSSGSGVGEFGRYGRYMFDDERITWSVDGGGRFFYRRPHRFSVTNVSGWMTIDSSVLRVKYLYYVLTVQWQMLSFNYTRKAHPSVIRDLYKIALPTVEEQDCVVKQLDAFDSHVNELSVGLRAELKARRTQYEYYRDTLLTFEGAAA